MNGVTAEADRTEGAFVANRWRWQEMGRSSMTRITPLANLGSLSAPRRAVLYLVLPFSFLASGSRRRRSSKEVALLANVGRAEEAHNLSGMA